VPVIAMTTNVAVRRKPLLPGHGWPQASCFCHGGATGQSRVPLTKDFPRCATYAESSTAHIRYPACRAGEFRFEIRHPQHRKRSQMAAAVQERRPDTVEL